MTDEFQGRRMFQLPGQDNGKGLICPQCHCRDLRVVRTEKFQGWIRRERMCRHCGCTFRTVEKSC